MIADILILVSLMESSDKNSKKPEPQGKSTSTSSGSSTRQPNQTLEAWRKENNDRIDAAIRRALDPSNVENFRRTTTKGI